MVPPFPSQYACLAWACNVIVSLVLAIIQQTDLSKLSAESRPTTHALDSVVKFDAMVERMASGIGMHR